MFQSFGGDSPRDKTSVSRSDLPWHLLPRVMEGWTEAKNIGWDFCSPSWNLKTEATFKKAASGDKSWKTKPSWKYGSLEWNTLNSTTKTDVKSSSKCEKEEASTPGVALVLESKRGSGAWKCLVCGGPAPAPLTQGSKYSWCSPCLGM